MHLWSRHHAKRPSASSLAHLKRHLFMLSLSALPPTRHWLHKCNSPPRMTGTGSLTATEPHTCQWISVGQRNEEHVNQQENKRKPVLFPVLNQNQNYCYEKIHLQKSDLQPTSADEDTHLNQAIAHQAPHCENWMMTEWGHGADHLIDSCLLAACSRTLPRNWEILSQKFKPTLRGAYWSNQAIWCILGWLFVSCAERNTKLGLFTDNTQQGSCFIWSYFKYFLFSLFWCCTYNLYAIKQTHTKSTK